MQFKKWQMQIYVNTQDKKKKTSKFYQHNACKHLEKEIHSLCWYNGINKIFKSMEQVICLCPLSQEISSLTVVFMKPFLSVKS